MNFVEVDACGLTKPLLLSIIRRAISISGGKPVVAIVDGAEAAGWAGGLAVAKGRKVTEAPLPDGRIRVEITA